MKKFKSFVKYKPLIAGFINKKVERDSTNQPKDRERDDYVDMFAGFLNKPVKIIKKIIKEEKKDINELQQLHQLHQKLSEHYKGLKQDFAHEKAITYYSQSGHNELNRSLHENGGKDLSPLKKSYDKVLSSALRMKKTPHKLQVYTGLKTSPTDFKGRKTGKSLKIRLPAYTSTSINKQTAEGFAHNKDDNYNKKQYVFTHNNEPVPKHIITLHNKLNDRPGYSDWSPVLRAKAHTENQPHFDKLAAVVKKHTGQELSKQHYGDRIKQKPEHDYYIPEPKIEEHETAIKNVANYAHVVCLHVPKGAHGAYIAHMSAHPNEKEFLLHKGAKIHLDATPNYNHQTNRTEWSGKLVHDGVKPTE